MTEDKRFIEVSFPIKEVGEESAREKYIRRGNISAIHIWWARKPLSVSRATNYASLISAPKNIEEWKETRKFIIELSKWDNSLKKSIINKARENILIYFKGSPPKVLDPFGGGGSIPLEAARLGCETYSNDYNPISVFIQKATLEYPKNFELRQEWGELNLQRSNKLFSDVHKWARIILENVSKEIQQYYPKDSDNSIPVGYIWSRTVICQNPSCCVEIPLIRQFWLSKRVNNVALYMYTENKKILFKIIGDAYESFPSNYNPSKGTIEKAIVTCPVCGNVIDDKELRKIFQDGKSSQKMIAVVLQSNKSGKKFRIATENDLETYKKVKSNLESKRKLFLDRYGIDPIPDELIPTPCHDVDRPPMYGMLRWGDLFNDRQKLALIKFTEEILEIYPIMSNEYKDKLYVNTIYNILNLALDKLIMFSSSNCTWKPTTTQVISAFLGRQAIPMTWDYF
ncbi:MAG: DUF1156 domain-containing protein, partial [Candidatus Methanofastidiosa archaeon]|nr:DUF1156 domain-containing protein [Candidatus Methanofastidiosa archaeon]